MLKMEALYRNGTEVFFCFRFLLILIVGKVSYYISSSALGRACISHFTPTFRLSQGSNMAPLITTLTLFLLALTASASPAPLPQLGGSSEGSGSVSGIVGSLATDLVFNSNGVPMGPAPKGCSKFEIIVGMSSIVPSPSTHPLARIQPSHTPPFIPPTNLLSPTQPAVPVNLVPLAS